jgi:hypothetical protein
MASVDPATELRRLVGKFALLFAFIYLLVLMAGAFRAARGPELPAIGWVLFLLPGAAFVPAVMDAVRLHRTSDPERMTALWRRCALYSVVGVVLVIATVVSISKINSP